MENLKPGTFSEPHSFFSPPPPIAFFYSCFSDLLVQIMGVFLGPGGCFSREDIRLASFAQSLPRPPTPPFPYTPPFCISWSRQFLPFSLFLCFFWYFNFFFYSPFSFPILKVFPPLVPSPPVSWLVPFVCSSWALPVFICGCAVAPSLSLFLFSVVRARPKVARTPRLGFCGPLFDRSFGFPWSFVFPLLPARLSVYRPLFFFPPSVPLPRKGCFVSSRYGF